MAASLALPHSQPETKVSFSVSQFHSLSKIDNHSSMCNYDKNSVRLIASFNSGAERPPSGAPYSYGKEKETHQ